MGSTPWQGIWRGRFERWIALAAPALDLLLNAGDLVSRSLAGPDDYYPIPAAQEALELDEVRRGTRRRRVETGD
jgi:hypothetical protein